MENLISKGINTDSKSLGAFYILSALTLVSHSAAVALPWLYESVVQNQDFSCGHSLDICQLNANKYIYFIKELKQI